MPEVARGASVGASGVVSPSPKTQLITETVVGVGGRGADRLGGFVCRPHPFDGRERRFKGTAIQQPGNAGDALQTVDSHDT